MVKGGSFLCAPNYCPRYRQAARQGQAVVLNNSSQNDLRVTILRLSKNNNIIAPANSCTELPPLAKMDGPYQLLLNSSGYQTSAFILVQDHPFMTVTDANGIFELSDVTVKPTTFHAFHVEAGFIGDIVSTNPACKAANNGFEIELRSTANDVGIIHVPKSKLTRGKYSFPLWLPW